MLSQSSQFDKEESELVQAFKSGGLSRRRFLQYSAGTSLAFLAGTESASMAGASTPAIKPGGSLLFAYPMQVESLDPIFSTQFGERPVLYCVFESLVTYDSNFNILPGLATSWKVLKGGSELVMKLRPNVKFHDGTPCNAAAVKFNYDRLINPATNSTIKKLISPPLLRVDVLNSTTVRFTTSQPWRPLLAALGERPGFIASPTAIKKYGKNFGLHPVGSGPFKFKEWVQGSKIVLEKNHHYWQKGKPYLNEIVFQNVTDPTVMVTMLQAGQAQVISDVPPTSMSLLLPDHNVKVFVRNGTHWYAAEHLVGVAPFDNLSLVQLEGYATNRQAVVQLAFGGLGSPGISPIPNGWAAVKGYNGPYPYSQTKAASLLTAAGGPQSVPFATASDSSVYQNITQAIQPGLVQAGLTPKLVETSINTLWPGMQTKQYDWGITDWTARADPDALLRTLFHTGAYQNVTGYSNPQTDQLLDEAAGKFVKSQAIPLYAQIIEEVAANGGYNYLAQPQQINAVRSNIGGFSQIPDDIPRLRDLYYKK
jgi:peptide/nickel transport system substrate-binding protein